MERIKYENERLLAERTGETEKILSELRDEVFRVEGELASVKRGVSDEVRQGLGRIETVVKERLSPAREEEGFRTGNEEDVAAGGVKGFQERVQYYKRRYG